MCVLRLVFFAGAATLLHLTTAVLAAEPCADPVGRVVSVQGTVTLQREPGRSWRQASLDQKLCTGDQIRVGDRSRAAVVLLGDGVIRIDQNTTLRLARVEPKSPSLLELVFGKVYFFSRRSRALDVNTPFVNAAVEGTEFLVAVAADRAQVTVYEGRVAAANDSGRLTLGAGQSAVARADQAPLGVLLVQPRDAVQWAVYYPPILFATADVGRKPAETWPASLQGAADAASLGETEPAFAALATVPPADRDADYHTLAASLLLSVGRITKARAEIERALALNPDAARAYALRAVIGVVADTPAGALGDAERAIGLAPKSAAAGIALSYAQQALLRLDAARDTLLRVVEANPRNALAWSRLAELWLELGNVTRAREAIAVAAKLAPDLERVQSIRGFIALTEFRFDTATDAFRTAVALNSASPLARFGLGLATIRTGDLNQGRNDIEVAVGLDPNRSLLRSYLGKAYFAERREALAGEQYAIARELDPRDPTPWFYDAILKQSENRPVEALDDLERSIQLNDNRAVYRSRMLLDQDLASRQVSVGRIYDNLGFEALGTLEATRSLTRDPANASAHRFLADVYAPQPRTEIARVSELLQAQLLQDININPVQPSLVETRLNIATGGLFAGGFNEFSSVFERNQARLDLTGVAGNNQTWGNEAVVSAIYDNLSLSAGQFHYQTDGFRDNNDLSHDIYNVYAQAALSPQFNIQAEVRSRRSENGDLRLNFDPRFFSPDRDRDLDQDTVRLGGRYSPAPGNDVIASVIYSNRSDKLTDTSGTDPFIIDEDLRGRQRGVQGEAQWIVSREGYNLRSGFGAYDIDVRRRRSFDSDLFFGRSREDETIEQYTGYVYGDVNLPAEVTWTLGLSYDTYEEGDTDVDLIAPKFGVQWDVTEDLRLRAVAARTLKPALLANQTIQPTQVAGFNQFFDDLNGTKAWLYGLGMDVRLGKRLYGGVEAIHRDLDEHFLDEGISRSRTAEETGGRAYLYWAPALNWAFSAELVYDLYQIDHDSLDVPNEVRTYAAPLGVRYFSPSGIFAGAGVSFVHQNVKRSSDAGLPAGDDTFYVLDAGIGYRFPHRRGLISVGIQNILDQDFNYQDDSYRKTGNDPALSPYIPDRTIIGRLTFNF